MTSGSYKRTKEHRRKLSKNHKRKWENKEFREKTIKAISKAQKRLWKNEKYRRKQGKAISKSLKGNKKCIERQKKLWQNKEFRKKTCKAMKGKRSMNFCKKRKIIQKKLWQNEEYAEKQHKAIQKCPNKKELLLNSILQQNFPKKFEMTVGGKFIIEGKNPDFVCKNHKYIIELFGDYWHNLSKTKKRDKRRLKSYKKYGFSTLIIWEHELKNITKVINKIKRFIK